MNIVDMFDLLCSVSCLLILMAGITTMAYLSGKCHGKTDFFGVEKVRLGERWGWHYTGYFNIQYMSTRPASYKKSEHNIHQLCPTGPSWS